MGRAEINFELYTISNFRNNMRTGQLKEGGEGGHTVGRGEQGQSRGRTVAERSRIMAAGGGPTGRRSRGGQIFPRGTGTEGDNARQRGEVRPQQEPEHPNLIL